jgi:hypothetical protein
VVRSSRDFACWSRTQERTEAALAIATEHGFGHNVGQLTFNRGLALAAQGQGHAGMAAMRQGLKAMQATGLRRVVWLALLAEAQGWVGQTEAGLSLVTEALA